METVSLDKGGLGQFLNKIKNLESQVEGLRNEVNSVKNGLDRKQVQEMIESDLGSISEGLRKQAQSEIAEAKEAITEAKEGVRATLTKQADERFDKLEARIDKRLGDFGERCDNFNARLEAIERNQKSLNQSIKEIRDEIEDVRQGAIKGLDKAERRLERLEK